MYDDLLTEDEKTALVSGKLMGHTRFSQEDDLEWNIRMDSFVHMGVWFEAYLHVRDGFQLQYDPISQCYKLPGRLSDNRASDLRIRLIENDSLRVDDMLNPEVWAECLLPKKLVKMLKQNKQNKKQKTRLEEQRNACANAKKRIC